MLNQPDEIRKRKWRTLLLMDAARYDTTKSMVSEIPVLSNIEKANNGMQPNTHHWLNMMFKGKSYPDLYLASAHPIYFHPQAKYLADSFTGTFPFWRAEDNDPVFMMERLMEMEIPPDKSLMIHFMQPHLPFIGPTGKALLKFLGAMKLEEYHYGGPGVYKAVQNFARRGHWEQVYDCYKESLKILLSLFVNYLDKFPHPIVITADHGEMIGEDDRYDHNSLHPVVTTVPYIRIE